ncbi:MAG: DUF5060 domain-containing protein, partial [bacterium]|nr:DUF5060 domain-containing protein [bacterium]
MAQALVPAEFPVLCTTRLVSTLVPLFAMVAAFLLGCGSEVAVDITADPRAWHPVTLTFTGPETSEKNEANPFLDYRLNVTFTGPSGKHVVPGYYAADGQAAESGAESGSKWRVHFVPDSQGAWQYEVSFRKGEGVAIRPSSEAGDGTAFDGATGSFQVAASNSKGMLRHVGERYLKFAGSGEYFLKGGADSPENFLAYEDFDGTWDRTAHRSQRSTFLHKYEPHIQDWSEGDPTWRGGKGKGIIGGLNYLASKGVNSVYFLTQNINGDGDDVWPWRDPEDFLRFDCSKLDQWEIVFQHMDRLGMMLHVVTAETENDHLLDGGELGPQRKLYYRELIARFSHHSALVWNLGEENTNSPEHIKAFSRYIHETDPYGHPVVMHTNATPEHHEKRYGPLLGYQYFDGASMQIRDDELVNPVVAEWIKRSGEARHQWVVTFDEQRTGATGVEP